MSADATKTRDLGPAELHPVARLPEEWQSVIAEMGERSFRARQIFRWIHHRGVMDPTGMTDLPAALRERLAEPDWPSRPRSRTCTVQRTARASFCSICRERARRVRDHPQ